MAQPKPTRKYEVSYQAKGHNKPVMAEIVEAHSESHVRCLIRASEGMIKNSKRLALQWLILLVIIAAMLFGTVKGAIWYFDMLLERNAMYAQGQTEIVTDHESELKAQWNKDGER